MGDKLTELPLLRDCPAPSVVVESARLAATSLTAVTVRDGLEPTRRRWFHLEGEAIAYAAQRADDLGLPLIDLREPVGAGE